MFGLTLSAVHINWFLIVFSALLRSEIDLLRDTQPAESKPSTEETEVQNKQITSQRIGSGKPNVPKTQKGDDS